jgi:phospholipid/cholesterol/gamma-HCH transport system permease protein
MNASVLLRPVEYVGRFSISSVRSVGKAGYLATGALQALKEVQIWGPRLVPQLVGVGVASVPIALFIALFTGIVLAVQASYTLTGAVPLYLVGALVGKTMIMELGPVLTGLSLAGRVGASTAAEIGTMRVTEQIDALETLAYDPLAYLVIPRVLAGVLMFPVVIVLASAVGVLAGWGASLILLDMSSAEFVRGLRLFFEPWDVQFAAIKSMSFGLIVTGVGSFYGFHTKGGAGGVGVATTRAVVVSSMLILVLDAFWSVVLL